MPKKKLNEKSPMVGWEEAMDLLGSLQDMTTSQLLNYATFIVLGYLKNEPKPSHRFDFLFFLDCVKEFSANKDFLKSVLDSKAESFPSEYAKIEKDIDLLKGYKCELPSTIETKTDFTKLSCFVNLNKSPSFLIPLFERINRTGHIRLLELHPAMKLISTIENPITKQLMHYANFTALYEAFVNPSLLKAEFDLLLFNVLMKDFCADHLYLRKVLDGEDLRWFSEVDNTSVA